MIIQVRRDDDAHHRRYAAEMFVIYAYGKDQTSIVRAVSESREACKLKYLTGAAPIVYGVPFYL